MMALFGRIRSGTADDVHQQLADLARAERAEAFAPDSTLPDGVEPTDWPDGWDEPTSDFFVPPDYRRLYRRGPAGSDREAELLAYWDDHRDPRHIEVSWGGLAPAGGHGSVTAGPGWWAVADRARLRHECEQLKLALAEATVQLRIWQKGAEFVDEVPSRTSRP